MSTRRDEELADWLAAEPWKHLQLPQSVTEIPTMISLEERELLYLLAREHWSGAGALIDAGCFLGGSTIALADGLLHRVHPPQRVAIHTYDLFVLDDGSYAGYRSLVGDLMPGDSTRASFDRSLGARLSLVDVHSGDVREQRWTGEPIEILFIDIAKQWSINDHVSREFFPALIPGQSVVIQQDYVHEWTPWLHITMELLGDAFTFVGSVPYCAAIFIPRRSISRDELPTDLRHALSDAEHLELFDRSASRFTDVERDVVECARVYLLSELDRHAEAQELLEGIAAKADDPRLDAIIPAVRAHLTRTG
jgi:hypothetical protein